MTFGAKRVFLKVFLEKIENETDYGNKNISKKHKHFLEKYISQ